MLEALLALLLACLALIGVMVLVFGRFSGSNLLDQSDDESWAEPIFNGILIVALLAFFSWFNLSLIGASVPIELNVTGAIVPIIISAYLIVRMRLGWKNLLMATLLVGTMGFMLTELHPSGIYIHVASWMVIVAFVAALSYALEERDLARSSALAYVAASLGMLFGGDILKFAQYPTYSGALVVGVGGIMDFVFLTGVAAVALIWGYHYLIHGPFLSIKEFRKARTSR